MVQTMDRVGDAAWPSPSPLMTGGAVAEGRPQASSPPLAWGLSSRTNRAQDGQPCSETSDVQGLCCGLHEREAAPRGFVAPCGNLPGSGPPLICCGTEVAEGGPLREQVIDEAGDCVGRGHEG